MTSPDYPLIDNQHELRSASNQNWRASGSGNVSPPPPQHHHQQQQQHAHNPQKETSSSPMPPGFEVSTTSESAAPPPGFNSGSDNKNSNYNLNSSTGSQGGSNQSDPGGRGRGSGNNAGQFQSNTGGGNSSSLAAALAKSGEGGGGGRTSSFVNLAAVLGTGLAESMDDATAGEWNNRQAQFHQQQQFGSQNSKDSNSLQDLSFARQSRHAAARLIGASPPRADPLGLEAGGAYMGGAPTSLDGNAPTFTSNTSSYNRATGLQSGFFSNSDAMADDALADFKASVQNRREGDAHLGVFGSNPNRHSQLPMAKDVGVTVMEPSDHRSLGGADRERGTRYDDVSGGILGSMLQDQYQKRIPDTDEFGAEKCYECEVERGVRNLWVDESPGVARSGNNSQQKNIYTDRSVGNSSGERSSHSQSSRQMAEAEIRPFIWETRAQPYQQHVEPSRCLVILRCEDMHIPDVRSTCEAFGVLESFRSDFSDRGIIFISYYDLRSAQYAALELEGVLKRNDCGGCNAQRVAVYYCVPLNSSSQNDESRIILADVPPYVDERELLTMLSSYGAVRSLRRQGGYYGGSSFEVEFHNVQDAKQAMLELESTQPLGPNVVIEVGMRPPIERKRGRELLATIGRWRHGNKGPSISPAASAGSRHYDPPRGVYPRERPEYAAVSSPTVTAPPETQLVLGPDGRYSYVVVENRSGYPPHHPYSAPPHHHQPRHIGAEAPRQQVVQGPDGQVYITTVSGPPPPSHHTPYVHGGPPPSREYYPPQTRHQVVHSHSPYPYDSRDRPDRGPYYSQHPVSGSHHPDHASTVSGQSHSHPPSSAVSVTGASMTGHSVNASIGGEDRDNQRLVLDLDAVESGRDTRTSLMVRNIPNKYTQQMLLNEFKENGLGPGVIDFFYLPIDFKNRCNRGYAFINFVDFKDILPFHRRYFGKHWSTFNSDKICDITYARIQGKAAMLKRFENSALMEKDEEYKPLVFLSDGPEKGKRIPFPEAAAAAANKH